MSNSETGINVKPVVVFVKSAGAEPLLGNGYEQSPESENKVCDQCPMRAGELAIDGMCAVPKDTKASPGSIKAGLKRIPLHILQLANYDIGPLPQDQGPPTCFHFDRWKVQRSQTTRKLITRAGLTGQIICKFINQHKIGTWKTEIGGDEVDCPRFKKCKACPNKKS